jgi:hypothetical protein
MRDALRSSVVGAIVYFAGWFACQAPGQTITQTINLRPGWNAVYLEAQPPNPAPDVVFSNLPLASVWTHAERLTSANFIQNPSEEAFNRAGWLGWFPADSPAAFLRNLHAITANRAYLVKNTNSAAVNWVVTGRPSVRPTGWVPDAFNLRGFAVPLTTPPTFLDYFRFSPAHFDSATSQLRNIYRLDDAGQWKLVKASDVMRRGEAVWVLTKGASDFSGLVEIRPEWGDGMDFDTATEELTLELRNRSSMEQIVTLALRSPTAEGGLACRVFEAANNGYQWLDFPAQQTVVVAANSTERLRLGIRRGAFNASYSAVLEVGDGLQTRYMAITAAKPFSSPAKSNHPLQGLWVGGATVTGVSEVNRDPTNVTPVQAAFPLRLLVHVDSGGNARFLKEVLQMWRDGTYTNDAQGNQVVDKPGEYVLLTDDRLIGQFKGATLRDGVPVGRRVSTAGFDFEGGTSNYLAMNGAFAISSRLALRIELGPNFSTNPFRHKYHPDHDNLDGRFVALTNNFEAYAVTREIELEFSGTDPTGANSPDFGYSVMGGTYRETLSHLHKNPIHLQGTFRLTRASYSGELNPNPQP